MRGMEKVRSSFSSLFVKGAVILGLAAFGHKACDPYDGQEALKTLGQDKKELNLSLKRFIEFKNNNKNDFESIARAFLSDPNAFSALESAANDSGVSKDFLLIMIVVSGDYLPPGEDAGAYLPQKLKESIINYLNNLKLSVGSVPRRDLYVSEEEYTEALTRTLLIGDERELALKYRSLVKQILENDKGGDKFIEPNLEIPAE